MPISGNVQADRVVGFVQATEALPLLSDEQSDRVRNRAFDPINTAAVYPPVPRRLSSELHHHPPRHSSILWDLTVALFTAFLASALFLAWKPDTSIQDFCIWGAVITSCVFTVRVIGSVWT